jgi:hypothetical protein
MLTEAFKTSTTVPERTYTVPSSMPPLDKLSA